ncbi:histone-lysine N-methyltransferase, H3 lysine-9 specific SUVH3-like [Carex rostrata]
MGRPRKSAQAAQENITVLDVKPIRTLAPMFPAPQGFNTYTPPNNPSFVCVTPYNLPNPESGSNPPGFTGGQMPPPEFFMGASGAPTPKALKGSKLKKSVLNPTPVQMKSPYMPPVSTGEVKKRRGRKRKSELITPDTTGTAGTSTGTASASTAKVGTSTGKRGRGRPRKLEQTPKKQKENVTGDITVVPLSLSLNPREAVEEVLMTFDALRRRILQLDEANQVKNAQHLKAGSIMMSNDLRVNRSKTIGHIPGIEVGDMYFFRIEMCLVGVNTQTVAGIDYTKGEDEDRLAVSIVSSGMYENAEDDVDTLIYSGQGMSTKNDQKLVKGNLALENSLKRGNEVRVVRSVKDHANPPNGKIYVYDGLYKIRHSWTEKAGSGFKVFKYKLFREPGQPDGISFWKKAEKWCIDPSSRGDVVVADISSGKESRPVCVVNEVDEVKGQPGHFTYTTALTYKDGINPSKQTEGCICTTVCLPGDTNCSCASKNGGHPPYSAQGVLVSRRPMIYECGGSCGCGISCRSRLTQKGVQLHFEVFKTADRGWGLRCWEPIRSGTFICEFTGEVMDSSSSASNGDQDDEYLFRPVYTDQSFKWNRGPQLLGEPSSDDLGDAAKKLNVVVSAKNMGNMSRFINHSCFPNLFWQPVVHDHTDEGHPHIVFFAMKHIPPMTELTYDYGLSEGESVKRKTCLCGSHKCRGTFG